MKFTVYRKTWLHGKGGTDSELLRADGMRCCIGFVGQQCGVPDEAMMGICTVDEIKGSARLLFPVWIQNDPDIGEAYSTNDSPGFSDPEREAELKEIFASHGDEIEFM
jgi:hypothetical protein